MKYSCIHKSDCYCITLCRAEHALTDFYDERLKELGITVKQYCLLTNLEKLQEAGTGELAEHVNLERSTLARNIQLLLSRGWIYDRAEEGRRAHRYALTEEGRAIVEKAGHLWEEIQEDVAELIGEEELPGFLQNLYKLQGLKLAK